MPLFRFSDRILRMTRASRSVILLGVVLTVAGAGAAAAGAWWRHVTRPDYRLRAGREALRQGDRARAERAALELRAAGHGDHAALLHGELFLHDARPQIDAGSPALAEPALRRALTEFEKVATESPFFPAAVSHKGECLLHLGQPGLAAVAFLRAARDRPDDVDAHRGLAAIYFDQGAYLDAVRHMEEVARLDTEDGRPYRMIGYIYKHLERYAEAVPALREALGRRLGPAFAQDVREDLAECLLRGGEPAEAIRVLDDGPPELAARPRALGLRAEGLLAQGAGERALPLVEGGLKAFPRSVELWRLRARLARDAGDTPGEIRALLALLEADRHDYAGRHQLALAFERAGDTAKAGEHHRLAEQTRADLAEISRLAEEAVNRPWDRKVRLDLASLCRKLGQPEEAERWARAAATCPREGDWGIGP